MKGAKGTSFATVVSITLILLIVGLMGKSLIYAYYFKEQLRQDVGFHVFLKESADSTSIVEFMKKAKRRKEVKSMDYISKEAALQTFINEGNEDPTTILDYNPLPASIHVYLHDSAIDKSHLQKLETYFLRSSLVSDVKYAEDFVEQINATIQKVSIIMIVIVLFLAFISVILIDNTIRLSMLNNRFIIKTLQYAGAGHFFIAMPYLRRGVFQGILGSLIAISMILSASVYAEYLFPAIAVEESYTQMLFFALIIIGALLAFFSTLISVIKYLKATMANLH